jgi:hypothetical protein
MRQFSSSVQASLDSQNIRYFFLIKLEFSQDYRFTSHSHDLEYDGETYLADGGLFEYDSPKISSTVDRESYKVVLSDIDNVMIQEFRSNVVGMPITVNVGFLDLNGNALTGTDDVVVAYKGFVDSPSINNDFESKTAVIEGTSPMSDLDAVNSFFTSRDGMDQKSTTDTTFDDMFENVDIKHKWGKK